MYEPRMNAHNFFSDFSLACYARQNYLLRMQQRLNTNTPIEHAVLYTSCLLFGLKLVATLQSFAPTGSGGLRAAERLYFLTCVLPGV